jgi:methanogenic corrinoid protein MtbC1
MISKTPLYNLNAVLREVGLTPDVLRAWERRYQLPVPRRTAGGHRLYSQYDIETIKWLKNRQQEGLSISRAVELWKEISLVSDPLENISTSPVAFPFSQSAGINTIDTSREMWVEACLEYDAIAAENILNQALSMFPVEKVCVEILQKGLSNIGEKWYTGKASAQQEHFATALAHNRIQALIAGTPKPIFEKTILIGCPAGELHTFPGLLINLFLRRQGFNVIYLGADVPQEQLLDTVNQLNPDLVILTAQRLSSAKNLAAASLLLNSSDHVLAYGGLIFTSIPELTSRIAGHYLGNTLEGSIEQARNLLAHPVRSARPTEISQEMQELARAFEEHRGMIEHRVIQHLKEKNLEIPYVIEASMFLGDDISAALSLGNLSFIDPDIAWWKNLQRKVKNPSFFLAHFEIYELAIKEELGKNGEPIRSWIFNTYPKIKELL